MSLSGLQIYAANYSVSDNNFVKDGLNSHILATGLIDAACFLEQCWIGRELTTEPGQPQVTPSEQMAEMLGEDFRRQYDQTWHMIIESVRIESISEVHANRGLAAISTLALSALVDHLTESPRAECPDSIIAFVPRNMPVLMSQSSPPRVSILYNPPCVIATDESEILEAMGSPEGVDFHGCEDSFRIGFVTEQAAAQIVADDDKPSE